MKYELDQNIRIYPAEPIPEGFHGVGLIARSVSYAYEIDAADLNKLVAYEHKADVFDTLYDVMSVDHDVGCHYPLLFVPSRDEPYFITLDIPVASINDRVEMTRIAKTLLAFFAKVNEA